MGRFISRFYEKKIYTGGYTQTWRINLGYIALVIILVIYANDIFEYVGKYLNI